MREVLPAMTQEATRNEKQKRGVKKLIFEFFNTPFPF